jgi:hypothetical protein
MWNMKKVTYPNDDVPSGPHYAVLIYKTQSVYIDGDERSRTCPGHGYPAHTETFNTFEHWVTTDKEDWQRFIEANAKDLPKMVCLEVSRKATVSTKVVVTTT